MTMRTVLLFSCLFFLLSAFCASPSYQRETNAKRIARGLPPLPPTKFARAVPGRRNSESASKTRPRASASPSPSPSGGVDTYTGRIQIRNSTDDSIGYVSKFSSESNEDLIVQLAAQSSSDPINVLATNLDISPSFVGARTSGTGILSADSADTLNVTAVRPTSPNATPVTSNGTTYSSAIWLFDSGTKRLTPQWINPDGSKPNTTVGYAESALFLAGGNSSDSVVSLYLAD